MRPSFGFIDQKQRGPLDCAVLIDLLKILSLKYLKSLQRSMSISPL